MSTNTSVKHAAVSKRHRKGILTCSLKLHHTSRYYCLEPQIIKEKLSLHQCRHFRFSWNYIVHADSLQELISVWFTRNSNSGWNQYFLSCLFDTRNKLLKLPIYYLILFIIWLAPQAGYPSCWLGITCDFPARIHEYSGRIIHPLLTKLVRLRWQDIGLILFVSVLWILILSQVVHTKCKYCEKRTWPISCHLDQTSLVIHV